jgi:hypothetical protein
MLKFNYSLYTVLLLCLCLSSQNANAQSNLNNTNAELVISYSEVTPKVFDRFVADLRAVGNSTEVVGFCKDLNLFIIRYNTKEAINDEAFVRKVMEKNARYHLEIKKGTSAENVMRECKQLDKLNN